jgi:hypothetical protein
MATTINVRIILERCMTTSEPRLIPTLLRPAGLRQSMNMLKSENRGVAVTAASEANKERKT